MIKTDIKSKLKFHSGMNLAEVLIALSLIGVVSMMVMPSIRATFPDEYDALYKRSVYALEHTVSDIVNNEDYYDVIEEPQPDGTIIRHHGLKNTYKITEKGQTYGDANSSSNAAKQKFCKLLASKMNVVSTINCTTGRTFTDPTFTTQDGVKWIIPIDNFSTNKNQVIAFYVAKDNKSKCGYLPAATKTSFFADLNNSAISLTLWDDIKQGTSSYKNKYGIMTSKNDCKRPAVFLYAINASGQLISPEALNDKIKVKD